MSTPHNWKEYHETMPPYSVCLVCGCRKSFHRERGTVYSIPGNSEFATTGEPQCRTDIVRKP